ncbi:tetratricopeptide repeat protein [Rubinisphaera sp. JC750]|uniref:tetratricopeptide repeat protein n=1 Tax=Rubinisphaera sp. JC750 TaxID=2898658 RepID=UPI001F2CE687|nr:tetratricopeptide repeat protein [Rubinisphaera sp. JC750]
MIACVHRVILVFSTVLMSVMLFSLCGCSRTSGFVMNESGQAYYKHGNYTLAKREFQKAVMDDPTNPHYMYNLATATQKNGDFATAEYYYRQALNLDPSHQPSYHGLATMMADAGRGMEAEQLLSAWAGSQPYLAEPHIELAWFQRTQGDYMGAEQSLRQALQINPQHERAIAQLGQVYESQGRGQEAMSLYQQSLFVNASQPEVRSRMLALEEQYPRANTYGQSGQNTMMAGLPGTTFTSPQLGYNSAPYSAGTPMVASYPLPQAQHQHQVAYPQANAPMMSQAMPTPVAMPAATAMAPPAHHQHHGHQHHVHHAPAQQAPMMAAPQRAPAMAAPQQAELAPPPAPAAAGPSFGNPQMTQSLPTVEAF